MISTGQLDCLHIFEDGECVHCSLRETVYRIFEMTGKIPKYMNFSGFVEFPLVDDDNPAERAAE